MGKYLVSLFYESIIRERWEVEANGEEEAETKAVSGVGSSQGERAISGKLVRSEVEKAKNENDIL